MVEAAGVEPKYPHGWRGFTSAWATWGPQRATFIFFVKIEGKNEWNGELEYHSLN